MISGNTISYIIAWEDIGSVRTKPNLKAMSCNHGWMFGSKRKQDELTIIDPLCWATAGSILTVHSSVATCTACGLFATGAQWRRHLSPWPQWVLTWDCHIPVPFVLVWSSMQHSAPTNHRKSGWPWYSPGKGSLYIKASWCKTILFMICWTYQEQTILLYFQPICVSKTTFVMSMGFF